MKAVARNIAEFVVIAADTEPVEIVLQVPVYCSLGFGMLCIGIRTRWLYAGASVPCPFFCCTVDLVAGEGGGQLRGVRREVARSDACECFCRSRCFARTRASRLYGERDPSGEIEVQAGRAAGWPGAGVRDQGWGRVVRRAVASRQVGVKAWKAPHGGVEGWLLGDAGGRCRAQAAGAHASTSTCAHVTHGSSVVVVAPPPPAL